MSVCDACKANKVCDHNKFGFENCGNYIPTDVVGGQCMYNPFVDCGSQNKCHKCGWNPYVQEKRLKEGVKND